MSVCPPPRKPRARTGRLLERAAAGDAAAVGELLVRHRPRLVEFVDFHLSPTIRGRFDASDVVQDAQAEMARRLPDYLARRPMPFPARPRKRCPCRHGRSHGRARSRPAVAVPADPKPSAGRTARLFPPCSDRGTHPYASVPKNPRHSPAFARPKYSLVARE